MDEGSQTEQSEGKRDSESEDGDFARRGYQRVGQPLRDKAVGFDDPAESILRGGEQDQGPDARRDAQEILDEEEVRYCHFQTQYQDFAAQDRDGIHGE